MYYLFLREKSKLEEYKLEFERVKTAIEEGKTPVQHRYIGLRTAEEK